MVWVGVGDGTTVTRSALAIRMTRRVSGARQLLPTDEIMAGSVLKPNVNVTASAENSPIICDMAIPRPMAIKGHNANKTWVRPFAILNVYENISGAREQIGASESSGSRLFPLPH
jgi:hypothetical protein